MKKILFIAAIALLANACTTNVKPKSTNTIPPPADSPGEPHQSQQGGAFSITAEAFYQASLASNTSKGQIISLRLLPEGWYEMTSDQLDKTPIKVDTGLWKTMPDGNLALIHKPMSKTDTLKMEFKPDGDKLVHMGKNYGTTGLVLWVKPLPKTQ